MPYTIIFRKMLNRMQKEYGSVKGKQIAFATAHKRGIKIDRYGSK